MARRMHMHEWSCQSCDWIKKNLESLRLQKQHLLPRRESDGTRPTSQHVNEETQIVNGRFHTLGTGRTNHNIVLSRVFDQGSRFPRVTGNKYHINSRDRSRGNQPRSLDPTGNQFINCQNLHVHLNIS